MLLKALYFFLPAYFANMAPVLFRKLPLLDSPISSKWLGQNKTWRGLVVGTLVGGLIFYLQQLAHLGGFRSWSLIDYGDFSVALGFLMGFGALLGDSVESYYKRKAGVAPGKPWIPFDQVDFVIGAIVVGFFVYVPPAEVMLILVIVSPLLHLLVNYVGFMLGLNRSKW